MPTAQHVRTRAVERQIATEYARDRIARALYEVINDGLAFGPRDLPAPADRDWIRGAMAIPIQDTTDVALHALAVRLADALDRAPTELVSRVSASDRWVELGWE